MSKKARIVKMIEEAVSVANDGRKTITYQMIRDIDLCPSYDCGERYNDVIYVMQIARQMGYKCNVGTALHLFPKIKQRAEGDTE